MNFTYTYSTTKLIKPSELVDQISNEYWISLWSAWYDHDTQIFTYVSETELTTQEITNIENYIDNSYESSIFKKVHSNLKLLEEDDHPQYLTEGRGDIRYGATISSTFSNKVINIDDNTIISNTQSSGDLIINNGNKFIRFPIGTSSQILSVNSVGDNLEFIPNNHSNLILDDGTNPHGTTKSDVGLGLVDNTSDLDKPISSDTQTALNNKQDLLISGTNIKTINNESLLGSGNISISGGGGSSRVISEVTTTTDTLTELEKIINIPDNTTSVIKVYIKSFSSDGSEWGVWERSLSVTRISGTTVIRNINSDFDSNSSGLKSNSISFEVNTGDIDIDVTGISSLTIDWKSAYEIIL